MKLIYSHRRRHLDYYRRQYIKQPYEAQLHARSCLCEDPSYAQNKKSALLAYAKFYSLKNVTYPPAGYRTIRGLSRILSAYGVSTYPSSIYTLDEHALYQVSCHYSYGHYTIYGRTLANARFLDYMQHIEFMLPHIEARMRQIRKDLLEDAKHIVRYEYDDAAIARGTGYTSMCFSWNMRRVTQDNQHLISIFERPVQQVIYPKRAMRHQEPSLILSFLSQYVTIYTIDDLLATNKQKRRFDAQYRIVCPWSLYIKQEIDYAQDTINDIHAMLGPDRTRSYHQQRKEHAPWN